MMTPDAALQSIIENTFVLQTITIPLDCALGYTLAEDIRSDRDQPPTHRSAMDGFAVQAADITNCPSHLKLIGEIPAGQPAEITVERGTCVRILTGAAVPQGADTVVMLEDTEESAGSATVLKSIEIGKNIRWKGEEAKNGDLLIPCGTMLGATHIGLCASVGHAVVTVHDHPRIAILCTGEELRDATDTVEDHQIRDSNGPMLGAALTTWGFPEYTHGTVRDDPETIESTLAKLVAENEIILLTGGVSVGKYDYVPQSVTRIGATIQFHKVAMKPGKPFLYATMPGNCHLFGLPGNPLSVITGFHEFVLPALLRMSGADIKQNRQPMFLPITQQVKSDSKRKRYVPAKVSWTRSGPEASSVSSRGSADLTSGCSADGVIVVPAGEDKKVGETVEFHTWRPSL